LNEAETKAKLIEPKLKECGWAEDNLEREYRIKNNRFYVEGEDYKIKDTEKFADYVLKVNNVIVGVVEAKRIGIQAEKGESQAKDYAKRLDVPITYATNGKRIILHDRRTFRTEIVNDFFSPEDLYQIYKESKDLEHRNISSLEYPYYISPGKKVRSYQDTAIKSVVEAIIKGQDKVLLTMATGTGKTFVSFQIVWKFLKSGFFSRVLFLTDRVFLRDQAYEKDFEPFGGARDKIMSGKFNKNRKIYFSNYQSLYSEGLYKTIPKDFFDLIIIDECHRSRYGDWGVILDHFENACNLGMTATPKREDNKDVYKYFGEPVFEYSLAQAIEDGFLVPYKIYKIHTNLDKVGADISGADEIIYDDDIDIGDIKTFYDPSEFERNIIIPDRTEKMCEKFLEITTNTDENAKSIIFCVDIGHAERVKDNINRLNMDENFAIKVVYEDKDDLAIFKDEERKYPLVATTVDLLSTGIDIPHLKNIVFMRSVNSKVLFKQIMGRGSRIANNKGFFRIIDFTNSTRLIDEWDVPEKLIDTEIEEPKEPLDKIISGFVIDKITQNIIYNAKVKIKVGRWFKETYTDINGHFILEALPSNDNLDIYVSKEEYRALKRRLSPQIDEFSFELKPSPSRVSPIIVKGLDVFITDEIEIEFDGETIAYAKYKKIAKDNIKNEIHDFNDLKELWVDDNKRIEFLDEIQKKRINIEFIKEAENLQDSDSFDVISHLVFETPLITMDDRAKHFLNTHMSEICQYGDEVKEIVFSMLEKYKKGGIETINSDIFTLPDMKEKNAFGILKKEIGTKNIGLFIKDIKKGIYKNTISP
jgi:type I restriction enzyme R subunit